MALRIYEEHDAKSEYWGDYWSKVSFDEQNQYLDSNFLTNIFYKYLSKYDEILEGGCGLGRWVYFLKNKGYKITGIEWSKDTVTYIKNHEPNIPIKVGDIFELEFSDNFFQSYISLGVIEHHENYQMALNEAYRVISDEGYLLCSVPYFNPVRQFKHFFGAYRPKEQEKFFEFRFKIDEISQAIRKSGFEIIEVIPFSVPYGITLEFPFVNIIRNIIGTKQKKLWYSESVALKNSSKSSNKLIKFIKYISNIYCMRYLFGHMVIIIAQKKG